MPIPHLPLLKGCDPARGGGQLAGGMAAQELGCLLLFIGGSGGRLVDGSGVQKLGSLPCGGPRRASWVVGGSIRVEATTPVGGKSKLTTARSPTGRRAGACHEKETPPGSEISLDRALVQSTTAFLSRRTRVGMVDRPNR
jgi:hypothetical protein